MKRDRTLDIVKGIACLLLNFYAVFPRHFHGSLFSVIPWIGFIFAGDYLHKNKNMGLPVFILLKLNDLTLANISNRFIFWVVCLAVYALMTALPGLFGSSAGSFVLFIY